MAGGDGMDTERVYTVSEVAALLHISIETVRRWLRSGELQGFMLGGTKMGYRIRATEVTRFLAAREKAAGSAPKRAA
jgi:excisionase family DNA binding protein